jgi:MFS transporter, ACS family, hexuronate transporter
MNAPILNQRRKWLLCVVLFLATVLNYMDRQTISLCKPKITGEFHMNNEQFGQLLAAFRWAYALMHVPAGIVADRFPIRPFFALAVGLWSFAGAVTFWVSGLGVFKATRALLGMGESVNWPFSTRIVANLFAPRDRGLGMGIFNSGAAIGALAAPLVITPVADLLGWRWAFLIVGSAGFVWIALWLWSTRGNYAIALTNPSAANPSETSQQSTGVVRSFVEILSRPRFWLLALLAIAIDPCWYFCCDWVPGFLQEKGGLAFLGAGLMATAVFLGGDLGNYAGGGLVKIFVGRGWTLKKGRGTTVLIGACLASGIALVPLLCNVTAIISLLSCAAFGINMIVPNQHALRPEFSFKYTAQVAGLLGLTSNVFAALVNPRIGRYVDVSGHYQLIFYLVALFPFIGAATILIFDRTGSNSRQKELKLL